MEGNKQKFCIAEYSGGRKFFFQKVSPDYGIMFSSKKEDAMIYDSRSLAEADYHMLCQKCKYCTFKIETI